MRLAAILFACFMLAGCATRPTGVLAPIAAAAPDATSVDMLVATTREPTDNINVLFTGERGSAIAYTAFDISIPPAANRRVGEVQWPRRLPANPEREFATLSATPVEGSGAAKGWLHEHLPKSKRVLIFVHGFNNQFEDAVYRFAQIVHDSGADAAPVLFTWPSRGSIFAYGFDRESANFSRDAFEQMVWRVASDPEVRDVTIMAHSMGAWLAMEGLRQMAIRRGHLPASIHNIILASPDLDVDVFAKQWISLDGPTARFTIFTSQNDRALALSRRFAGNIDRLGQIDPSAPNYYARLERAGIVVIDLTALRGGDSFNHNKFAESPEVVQLIGTRLVAGQKVTDSDPSLGEVIGATAIGVGQAAGGVITAPIAVFDPALRRAATP
ncbi:alpha/beta hydrolase [Ancylobacter pratisalsi]|uniref:Alpha/beta hydrolase n=1 Tax=Ancylobacter pratisalsi TaxID=1745854 RepID=A0A6P1YPI2_9HYPH|nr:alpha/beta hydrolase [Ancylobacter pratisalsi]QIB33644.1 alpha/beta hydrolase [Ancylobacter pratisalsi]